MTGPDHYREAERLLSGQPVTDADRLNGVTASGNWPPSRMDLLAAQVHATLALAAATALNDHAHAPAEMSVEGGLPMADWKAWRETAGTAELAEPPAALADALTRAGTDG